MKTTLLSAVPIVLVAVIVPVLLGCAGEGISPLPIDAEARAGFAKTAADASVLVLPVQTSQGANVQFGAALALTLETQAGMKHVRIHEAPLEMPNEATIAERDAAVRGWLSAARPAQPVLFAEFVGTPQAGATELRGLLYDAAGKLIWNKVLTEEDWRMSLQKPTAPLMCCIWTMRSLRNDLGLPQREAYSGSEEGPIEQWWSAKSKRPEPAEFDRMRARLETLKNNVANTPLVIVGAQCNGKVAAEDVTALAESLRKLSFKSVAPADALAGPFELPRTSNQQLRLWSFARKVKEQVSSRKSDDGAYTLFAEYGIDTERGVQGFTHFVLCDPQGEWVIVDFQNSHHAHYNMIKPKSAADCHKLITKRLEYCLR